MGEPPAVVRIEPLRPFFAIGWISSCNEFFYVVLNALHKIYDHHFVVFLCPSRRFDMHEPSNFPVTSDKKPSHSFTDSSFTVFLVPPPFSTRDAFLHMFLSRNFFRPFIHKA